MCNRQFTVGPERTVFVPDRPSCPACGKKMYLYMREEGAIRFRCSDRPHCRAYVKMQDREREREK